MVVGERPVHQIEVEVVQAEVGQRILAGAHDVVVTVVPHFGSDPEVLALHDSLVEERFERSSDLFFIAVDGGAVDVAVACLDGLVHSLGYYVGRIVVRTESAQAHCGNDIARRKRHLRDKIRIDEIKCIHILLNINSEKQK